MVAEGLELPLLSIYASGTTKADIHKVDLIE